MRLVLLRGCRLHSASAKADATLGFTSCIRALHLLGCSLPEGGRARSAESLPLFLQSQTILTSKNAWIVGRRHRGLETNFEVKLPSIGRFVGVAHGYVLVALIPPRGITIKPVHITADSEWSTSTTADGLPNNFHEVLAVLASFS